MIPALTRYFPVYSTYKATALLWKKRVGYQRLPNKDNALLSAADYVLRSPVPEAVGKRIAFVSDLHWNGTEINRRVAEALEALLTEKRADYLILGGDIVGDADHLAELDELLPRLRKCVPLCFAIDGNWECGKRWFPENFWHDFYRKYGIVHLCNETWEDDLFHFSGTADISSGLSDLPPPGDERHVNLLLSHSPDTVVSLDALTNGISSYDLILCGHTHGGQVRLPLLGAPYVRSRYGRRFDYGMFRRHRSSTHMIVSGGLGECSCSFRFNCRREVVFVHFRASHHLHRRGAK